MPMCSVVSAPFQAVLVVADAAPGSSMVYSPLEKVEEML